MKMCSECKERPVQARGFCHTCYCRKRINGEMDRVDFRALCHPDRPHYGKGLCRACYKDDYQSKNPDKIAKYTHTAKLKRFELADEEYKRMLKEQKGLCAICFNPPRAKKRKVLSIDHDHSTGKVRGLVCANCNRGLHYLDKPHWLDQAFEYLENANVER